MAYVFRGANKDERPIKQLIFDHTKCGTRKGYKQHQNHGVPACEPCKAAHNEYMKDYYRARQAA